VGNRFQPVTPICLLDVSIPFRRCWIRLHRFWLYTLEELNALGGGDITLDFMVSRLDGNNGNGLFTSLNVSVVSSLELITASTSTRKVWNSSSFKLRPWLCSKEVSIALTDLIWRSHTPPWWLTLVDCVSKTTCSATHSILLVFYLSQKIVKQL